MGKTVPECQTALDVTAARYDGELMMTTELWIMCKLFAPRSLVPANQHSFSLQANACLPLSQQCQSTQGAEDVSQACGGK